MKDHLIVPLIAALLMVVHMAPPSFAQHLPTESTSARDVRMQWWREARFGMFIHWGVYAVPARGEWVMYNEKIPVHEYEKFPSQFNPVKFNAGEWVRIAKAAGVRYIVITSKHHDGFCMWDSKITSYDIVDATPFGRDPLAELSDACRKEGIRLCFYYSIMDWHNPLAHGESFARYRDDYMRPQLKELITRYHPAVLWFDGQWIAEWDEDQGRALYEELHALDPLLIMNNRIGKGRNETVGSFPATAMTGDFATPEQYIPGEAVGAADWESCMTMNDNWGYAAKDTNWKSTRTLIRNLVEIASKGGNYLLNVGPTAEGEIPANSVERLRQIGQWLRRNGESIYGSQASPFDSTPWGRCTSKIFPDGRTRLYLHLFGQSANGQLVVPGLGTEPTRSFLSGDPSRALNVRTSHDTVVITLPQPLQDTLDEVVVMEFTKPPVTFHRPRVVSPAPIFLNRTEVSLSVPVSDLDIRYTIDGKTPTTTSALYSKAIRLTTTTVLKVQSFYRGKPVSEVVERTFDLVTPLSAVPMPAASPGLKYDYYEGDWKSLPDFDILPPASSGVARTIGLDVPHRQEKFGLRFTGFLTVPETGVFQVALNSDDGSKLLIGPEFLIDNDGLHSATEKKGFIALTAGAHPFTVFYFNGPWEGELSVRIAPAERPLEPVREEQFSHIP